MPHGRDSGRPAATCPVIVAEVSVPEAPNPESVAIWPPPERLITT
ncbi:hypothetical protein [Amaricoccus sp. W119]